MSSQVAVAGPISTIDCFRKLRASMGRAGGDYTRLILFVDPATSVYLIKEFVIPEFVGLDKYGENTMVITGECGRIDGVRVVMDEDIRNQFLTVIGSSNGDCVLAWCLDASYRGKK